MWNPLLILTPGRVGISQVVQKSFKNNKRQTESGRKKTNTDSEPQTQEGEVGTF